MPNDIMPDSGIGPTRATGVDALAVAQDQKRQ